MAVPGARRVSALLLLATSILVFTGCLQLASTKAGRAAHPPISGTAQYKPPDPHFEELPSGTNSSSPTVKEWEDVLFDGVRRFVRTSNHAQPELIFLVLTKDKSSWGQESRRPARTFYDFLDLINSTAIDLNTVSLGLMTSSEEEYDLYKKATAGTVLPRVTILFRRSDDDHDPNWWTSVPRGGRHAHAIQIRRRMHVATLRNELMSRTLHDERHLVWVDSDIQYLSPGIVQTMLNHSATVEDAGIMTARCQMGWNTNYDANSWAGARYKNPATGLVADDESLGETERVPQKHITELISGTSSADIVHLDSVGGVILYIRASLLHQGLSFPPYNVIGTSWGKDGWDGLETEGVCYVARYLRGGGCYVLGGDNSVEHTNN